jgi:thiamine phosphate synthase YjbQ (UPF0047 family)
MSGTIQIKTSARNQFLDITGRVKEIIAKSGLVDAARSQIWTNLFLCSARWF